MERREFYDEIWQSNDRIVLEDGTEHKVVTVNLLGATVGIGRGDDFRRILCDEIVEHRTLARKEDQKFYDSTGKALYEQQLKDKEEEIATLREQLQEKQGSIQELAKRIKELAQENAKLTAENEKIKKSTPDGMIVEILKKIDITVSNHTGLLGYIEKYYEQICANRDMMKDLQEYIINKEIANE